MALQEGQPVLLEVALKNGLPSEARGQRLYSVEIQINVKYYFILFYKIFIYFILYSFIEPGESWSGHCTSGQQGGEGRTQHLPRHIPAWKELGLLCQ